MKNLTALALLLVVFSSNGQKYLNTNNPKDEGVKSLLNKNNDLNGFGGVDMRVGDIKGMRGMLVGAYGGVIINRRFLFGIGGYGIVTKIEFDGKVPGDKQDRVLNLHGGYGGLLVGGTIAPKELVHISVPVLLGAGSLDVVDKDFFNNGLSDSEFTIESSVFFVVEPGVEIEFNISSYFRLGFGASYRYVSGTDLKNVSDKDVSGVTGMVSFRFGKF